MVLGLVPKDMRSEVPLVVRVWLMCFMIWHPHIGVVGSDRFSWLSGPHNMPLASVYYWCCYGVVGTCRICTVGGSASNTEP